MMASFQQGFQPPMLIFVQSKERAKELFHELIYDGINVDVIHSDRTQAQVSFGSIYNMLLLHNWYGFMPTFMSQHFEPLRLTV